jgi:hypothetical protein
MLSLIRRISIAPSSQPSATDVSEQNSDDEAKDITKLQQHAQTEHQEVDGTAYDPNADPRDPETYYTFPHFTNERLVVPVKQQQKDAKETTSNANSTTRDNIIITTPTKSPSSLPNTTTTSTSSSSSPPFWPISPQVIRTISRSNNTKSSTCQKSPPLPHHKSSSPPLLPWQKRRVTSDQTSLTTTPTITPKISQARERPLRTSSAQAQLYSLSQRAQQKSPESLQPPNCAVPKSGTGGSLSQSSRRLMTNEMAHSPTRGPRHPRSTSGHTFTPSPRWRDFDGR